MSDPISHGLSPVTPQPGLASTLQPRWQSLHDRIALTVQRCRRPANSVQMLAVSKTRSPEDILQLSACGQTAFGENYVQEAQGKIAACRAACASQPSQRSNWPDQGEKTRQVWHFIGPIQSNKTRSIAAIFDWVQSIDQARLASRLAEQRPASLAPLQVCIQVNLGNEVGKRGCAPQETFALAEHIARLPRLTLRGLMIIPEADLDPATLAQRFNQAKTLYDALRGRGIGLDTLSMGMSNDLEAAIAAGATQVRVGSALFGPRAAKPSGSPEHQPD